MTFSVPSSVIWTLNCTVLIGTGVKIPRLSRKPGRKGRLLMLVVSVTALNGSALKMSTSSIIASPLDRRPRHDAERCERSQAGGDLCARCAGEPRQFAGIDLGVAGDRGDLGIGDRVGRVPKDARRVLRTVGI